MVRATVEGMLVGIGDKIKKNQDGSVKDTVKVLQILQTVPGKSPSLVFVETHDGKDHVINKPIKVAVLIYPYGRKDGSAEVSVKAEE